MQVPVKYIERIGRAIRKRREGLTMSPAQLASSFEPPVTTQAVSLWERGKAIPRLENQRQLLKALDLKVWEDLEKIS